MKRRRIHRSVSWLLPLIAARMLVPAGFMLGVGERGIGVVLCSGYGSLPHSQRAVHEHQGHDADHTHQQQGGGSEIPSGGALCLFAVAAAACDAVAWAMPAALERPGQQPELDSAAVASANPFLPGRIRGPPLA